MFCNKCGKKLDEDSMFCAYCGAKVIKEKEEKSEQNNTETSAETTAGCELDKQEGVESVTTDVEDVNTGAEETPVTEPEKTGNVELNKNKVNDVETPPVQAMTEPPVQENKKKSKSGMKIAGAAAAVVLAGLAAVGILTMKGASKDVVVDPVSQCNFNNLAFVTYDENSIYYIGTYDSSDDETCVYSTSYSGTNKTKILEDDDIVRIRIIGDQIYYLKSDDSNETIGRVNKDGSDNKTIIKYKDNEDEMGYEYNVYGDTLYYITGSNMRSCTIDGENDTQVKSSAYDFVMVGDLLYYSDKDTINIYNMKTKEETELCAASKAEDLVYEKGNLFYRTSSGLFYKATDKDEPAQKISGNSSLSKYIIDKDVIYFLEKMDTDDVTALAKYMAEDNEKDYLKYAIMMIGVSELKRVDKFGGNEEYQDSDQALIFCFYDTPGGKFSKLSAFSDSFEPLEIN